MIINKNFPSICSSQSKKIYKSFVGILSKIFNRKHSTKFSEISKIRNLGIIAHVDAGKTTTSERMLYYSGESSLLGDVDHGDTMLDYLEIEKERGITINSAAITFRWNNHSINLIDTPGRMGYKLKIQLYFYRCGFYW